MRIFLIIFIFSLALVPLSILDVDAVSFKDRLGYIPSWASSMGDSQALSTCINVDYTSRDFEWCTEFSGYVTDKMMGNIPTTSNNQQAIPTPKVQEPSSITKSQETAPSTTSQKSSDTEVSTGGMIVAAFIVFGLPVIVIALIIWKIKKRKKSKAFKI